MANLISVPDGGGGTVLLSFPTAATASLATDLLAAVYNAGSSLVVGVAPSSATVSGTVSEYIIGPGSTGSVTVPAGYNYILDQAVGAVTIVGNGGTAETFVATSAASTASGDGFFLYNLGSGTVVAGSGSDSISNPGSTANLVTQGDATYTTFAAGGTFSGSGTVIVSGSVNVTGTGALVFSSGANPTILNTGGADTFVAGAGPTTIFAAAGGGTYFDSSGPLVFVNSVSSTVVSGSFASTIFGGAGNSAYFTGAGNVTLVNGPGATSAVVEAGPGVTTVFDSAGGAVELYGTSHGNTLVASAGAETLGGAYGTGGNVFFAGSGSDLVSLGIVGNDWFVAGTGSASVLGSTTSTDVFAFVDGAAGGSDTLFHFNSADFIDLLGYGAGAAGDVIATQKTVTGGVLLTLPDKTVITVAGISSLSASQVFGS